jgi:hypothetical protein
MNMYRYALMDEYAKLSNSIRDHNGLRKKSKAHHLAKLRRYIARTRGEYVPNQKWLAELFEGRPNRTPWKLKSAPYISKAKRSEREERFAKVLGFLNGK